MLRSLDILSDVDRMQSLIRKGESKTLEFKQTFSLNIYTCKKDKIIEKSSLKTVAAFLNTDGGSLLIGVDDNGNITGLREEMDKFHKSEDNFLLHFKDLIEAKIGGDFYPFIKYHIVNIDGMKVLFVECDPSTHPCYYNKDEFFVRTNPATDQLKGPKVFNYIKIRFPDAA
jgi:predicted HTH transcriptional regulator